MPPDVHLSSCGLTADNLDRCIELWGDRGDYAPREFATVLDRVRRLLRDDRARASLIVDQRGKARAFGVSVFVDESTADAMAKTLHPQLGKWLLQDPNWNARILRTDDVGRRNATSGLQMVVVTQGYDDRGLSDEGWAALLGALIHAFIDTHQGFRIKRIIMEAFGQRGCAFIARTWPNVVQSQVPMANGSTAWTARWAVTRIEAEQQGGALLPMFSYRPPLLALTLAEREVLRVAVTGVTDQAIADVLEIPVASVKSRWSRILRRAAQTVLAPQLSPAKDNGERGRQARHVVVEHVRQNPSELTPFETPARRNLMRRVNKRRRSY